MIKLICVVKRNPSLSIEEFHEHWRGPHARLISETPGVADRIVRYEQNHRAAADYKRGGNFDGVAIQWFESMDDFVAMVADPEYQAHVSPDERKLLDLDGLVWILTDEEEVVIPGPAQRDEPVIKLVCMVKRRPGMAASRPALRRTWSSSTSSPARAKCAALISPPAMPAARHASCDAVAT